MATTIEHGDLKEAVKQALLELLRERPAEVLELVEQALEEIEAAGLVRAIQEGEETEVVSWEEVEATLRGDG